MIPTRIDLPLVLAHGKAPLASPATSLVTKCKQILLPFVCNRPCRVVPLLFDFFLSYLLGRATFVALHFAARRGVRGTVGSGSWQVRCVRGVKPKTLRGTSSSRTAQQMELRKKRVSLIKPERDITTNGSC